MTEFVKIRRHGERFWCEVVGHPAQGILQVRVDNDLIGEGHGLKMNDVLNIRASEVLDVQQMKRGQDRP